MQRAITPPHNHEAEVAVLGSLMINTHPQKAETVFGLLKVGSFYLFAHNQIFAAMLQLHQANQPIDMINLDHALKNAGVLDDIGGFAYLAELAKNTPSSANMVSYAEIVRDCAIKRFALAKINECEKQLFDGMKPAETVLENISTLFSQIGDYAKEGKTSGVQSAQDIASEWVNEQLHRESNPDAIKGLRTGIEALDDLLAPKQLIRGGLLVVGARPKVGKTAFYCQLALQCVCVEKKRAVLFSLEMGRKQIFERMLGQWANINTNAFYHTNNRFEIDEIYGKATRAMEEITEGNRLFIDDTPAVSMAHIRSECRRILREEGEIGLVAVDYLTLMSAEQAERNDLAYGKIVKEMKNLARELNCVVLLLTQLNRGLESRSNKRPQPSDSRDTGQIEQECDYWIGLHREGVYDQNADPHLTEIIVNSNRHGTGGTVYVDFRNGAIRQLNQAEAYQRSEQSKPYNNKRKGDF